MASKSIFWRIMRGLGRSLDWLRRALHLIVLLGVFAALIALLSQETVFVPNSAALVLAPSGVIVEQLSGDPLDRAFQRLQGDMPQETLLFDLVDALRRAKDDERIQAVVIQLDALAGSGLSKLQELGTAIDEFRAGGKPVFATAGAYDRDQYYLAARADEIFLHPMGSVLVEGYSKFLPYYKSALDSLLIDYEVWTAGEYKSFTEPYTRDGMSDEDRVASQQYLDSLWNAYQQDVTARRGLPPDALQSLADRYTELLRAADGNAAQLALDLGLVDTLASRQAVNDRLLNVVGASSAQPLAYSRIDYASYLASFIDDYDSFGVDAKVAVLTLAGTIYDGSESPGAIGGDSAARAIGAVTADDDVKALVLRVDSPGGSAYASDVILDALKAFQATGRPLVVSMGSVAASGGYWISMTADEIWASATTITGSIGVGALLPTIPRALDWAGVHVDGIGTTRLAGQFSMLRGLGDDAREYFSASVASLYRHFVSEVAASRERGYEEIDSVARGRVWVGSDALEYGLVDRLGTLDAAIESAAALAGLEAGEYRIDRVEPQLDFAERLAVEFAGAVTPLLSSLRIEPPWLVRLAAVVETTMHPLSFVGVWNDPRGLYTYCLCDIH